jgi:LL-diaminopimelate aminotransferase
MKIEQADRLKALPPYLFAELDRMKAEVAAKGIDIISLGIGDPDLPTPPHIISRLKMAVDNPVNHQYPSYEGMPAFREAVAAWYSSRFGAGLDPQGEVVSLIGSKEGIAHFPLAFINPGDVVLCPDPAYPVYSIGTLFAGGEAYFMPLLEENGFLPELESIPKEILKRAKLMFLNYPNNPTSAVAARSFFEEVVEFAGRNGILVCHDAAYTEVYFDGERPLSFLQIPGASEVGIEFNSLSKPYNMTGWRIGWACGNARAIQALGKIKTNIDSGIFQAVQEAGIEALNGDQGPLTELREIYRKRRDMACASLSEMGYSFRIPTATFYLWIRTPGNQTSAQFAGRVLTETGVVVTPGNGFGTCGEGYFRISLTIPEDRLSEALSRIESVKW